MSYKQLSKHVTDVNSTSDVIPILDDEKYIHAFEKYVNSLSSLYLHDS